MSNEIEKVVIIGSGCAGLTAALYTARAQLKPVVLTGAMPGGLLTTTSIVENFPGWPEGIDGTDLMIKLQQQAERFGAEVRFGSTVESVDLSERPFKLTVDGEPMLAQTLIVASGAGHRHLGLESEKKLDKKGVTYCATCDGALPMFRDQPLVVVGGGDSACEEATYLTRFASKVYLVHRRDELRASKIMRERAKKNPKIDFIWDSVIEEIKEEDAIREANEKIEEMKHRMKHLRELKSNALDEDKAEDFENIPAYKRKGVKLDNVNHSSESEVSRYSLIEEPDKKPELNSNNSFLHDNVD